MCLDLSLQPKVQSLWNRLLTPSSSSQLCVDRNRWTVTPLRISNFARMCNKIVVISFTTTHWQKRNFSLVEGLVKLKIALYGGQESSFRPQELVKVIGTLVELITRTSFGGNGCGRTRERLVCEIRNYEESDFTGFHFPFFGRIKRKFWSHNVHATYGFFRTKLT